MALLGGHQAEAVIPPIIDLPDPLMRLSVYRAERERERVMEALAKEPEERTEADEVVLAYSQWGHAAGCSC